MANINFQINLFCNGPAWGWSETYFWQGASPTLAASFLSSLADARKAIMCADCEIQGARISETEVKNDSYPTSLTLPILGTFSHATGDATAPAGNCLRSLYNAGPTLRGNRWVHAIPKSQYTAATYVHTSDFESALETFLELVEENCCIGTRIKGATAPPFYTLTPYTGRSSPQQDFKKVGRPFGLLAGRRRIA